MSLQEQLAHFSVELCALRILGLCFGYLSQLGTELFMSVFQILRGCINVVKVLFCGIVIAVMALSITFHDADFN